jgi:hypothetical protein
MSLISDIRSALFCARGIPGELGLRPYTVAVVTDGYDGGEVGQGTRTTISTPITEGGGQPPKVRFLSTEQRVLAGLGDDSVEVGPITPTCSAGGTAFTTLVPLTASDDTIYHFLLTGPKYPNGARFRLVSSKSDHAGHFMVTLEKAADT